MTSGGQNMRRIVASLTFFLAPLDAAAFDSTSLAQHEVRSSDIGRFLEDLSEDRLQALYIALEPPACLDAAEEAGILFFELSRQNITGFIQMKMMAGMSSSLAWCEDYPLHCAAKFGTAAAIDILLRSEADMMERDSFGLKPWDYAIGREELIGSSVYLELNVHQDGY
jgi:hypothetical protein